LQAELSKGDKQETGMVEMRSVLRLLITCCLLLVMQDSYGQNDFPGIREQIYIHFDQNTYITGETCWFRVHLRQKENNNSQPSQLSKVVYLEFIDNAGQPAIQKKIKINNGAGEGSIYLPIALSSGNYAVRAYTSWMRNFPETNWFNDYITIINPFVGGGSTNVSTITSSANVDVEPIELNFPSTVATRSIINWSMNIDSTKMPAQLSMSVYRIDSLDREKNMSINSDISNAPTKTTFLAETSGPVLEVESRTGGSALPGKSLVYLSIKGSSEWLYGAKSAGTKTSFAIPNVHGERDIIIQSQPGTIHTVVSPFADEKANLTLPSLMLKSSWQNDIIQRSTYMQVRNIFNVSEIRTKHSEGNFYDNPDERYILDQFTRFPLMEEVFREIIKGVQLRKRKEEFHLSTLNSATKTFFNDDALILLDGTPMFNANKIMSIDPLLIESIDVITSRYVIGPTVFNGIIHLRSYKRDMAAVTPEGATIGKYHGLLVEQPFLSPDYSKPVPSNQPDFRQLLHWQTFDIVSGGAYRGSFYSSDLTGVYRIVVNGITSDGQFLHATSTISIAK
jgi:hypothetical protein